MRSAVVLLVASCALLSGCELVADFDRSKIVSDASPEPSGDGSVPDDGSIIDPPPPDEDSGSDEVEIDASTDEDAGL